MRKQSKYSYKGMNQDVSKDKHSQEFYWEAKNIRVITNSDFGSCTNVKGNELVITLDTLVENPSTKPLDTVIFPVINLKIIHTEKIDEKVILFTTNQNVDCIWLVEQINNQFTTSLLYIDNLGFKYGTQIESVGINESEQSQKVYWVDGINSPRFLNIKDNSLNKEPNEISFNPDVTLLDPSVDGFANGGNHKAGVIQYSYSLYNKFGVQTKISGTSELVSLYNNDKGLPLDASANISPIVLIENINQNFGYIQVYSIFYSSLNQIPKISLIYEGENNSSSLKITDNNDIIRELSLAEYNLLNKQKIIPKYIKDKDNNLFFGNYSVKSYNVDFDSRAFSFKREAVNNGFVWSATFKHLDDKYNDYFVWDTTSNTETRPANSISFSEFLDLVPLDHDVINEDETAMFQHLTSTIGGTGKNISYNIFYTSKESLDTSSLDTSLKRGEKYRVGITFFDSEDNESFVSWINDIKVPGSNEESYVNILNTEGIKQLSRLNVTINNLPDDVKSYKLVRVERKNSDKRIKTQGIVNPCILQEDISFNQTFNRKLKTVLPSYIQRTFNQAGLNPTTNDDFESEDSLDEDVLQGMRFQKPINYNTAFNQRLSSIISTDTTANNEIAYNYDDYLQNEGPEYTISNHSFILNSSDITFNKSKLNINNTDSIRIVGFIKNNESLSNIDFYTRYDLKKEEPDELLPRINFTYRSPDSFIYMFQVDTPDDDTDLPSNVQYLEDTPYPQFFFKISEDSDQIRSTQVFLVGALRPKFQKTVDSVNFTINRWEFKKCFYKRKFDLIFNNNTLSSIAGLNQDEIPVLIQPINNRIFLQNVKHNNNQDISNGSFDPISEITGYSKFSAFAGTSVYIGSQDLHALARSYYNNLPQTNDCALLVEIINNNINQYGGNTFNDRQRNVYIPFSKKQLNLNTTQTIEGVYGDTYIQENSLLRIFDNTTATGDIECRIDEIVQFPSETSINNDMRYDNFKIEEGNNLYNEELYGYNSVYSQQSILNKSITKPSDFVEETVFRSEVIASNPKVLGEFIDSWTIISVNDKIIIDTKYGGITGFGKLKDTLIAFQRNAISYLVINPRVQLSTSDGIPVTLGTGKLIERYEYISTLSGTLHSKSIHDTEMGIYYYDILNKSISLVNDKVIELSTLKGMYNYFKEFSIDNYNSLLNNVNNIDLNNINNVITHYDNDSEDIILTFIGEENITIAYNLLTQSFTSFYDFTPNIYFNINNTVYSSNQDNKIWRNGTGEYNKFYDVYYPSKINILINPESNEEKIFDNLSYMNDVTLNNSDVPITFNNIRVYHSYQDTGQIELQMGKNIKRKFRKYNLIIPREQGTRNRIRNQFCFIELIFNKPGDNYKFVLYDTIIDYTIN